MLSEVRRHGWSSRFGQRRADLRHQPLDVLIVAGPWLAGGWLAYKAARRVL